MKYQNNILYLSGNLLKGSIPGLLKQVSHFTLRDLHTIDLQDVADIDSAGVAFLDEIIARTGREQVQIINKSPQVAQSIETFSSLGLKKPAVPARQSFFYQAGQFLYDWWDSLVWGTYLTADILYWSVVCLFRRKGLRKGAVINQGILIGVDALGIISLLSLILGLILALQSAAQLRQFGANIFIADLIAISMVREMGPMMTAIIVAGRSGSAIASEIATMKVTEEIDALRMMALDPVRYVIVPKFHAITICMPLLVTMSTLIGIFGGLIIAVTYLDLTPIAYLNQALNILTLKDVLVGLLKSLFFAWVIVIISSYYGLRVKGGAEGVGKVTTLSVVASIFWVIVLDAINSLIFYF
ncbi:MAG: MlaE family lipid ABC transporter permease subunit [Candidatus Cloacimonetes bacterium]|nr:MlaE family lipid ABC transporter permease subunit [Candidatus Cloacimonadota bacterium]